MFFRWTELPNIADVNNLTDDSIAILRCKFIPSKLAKAMENFTIKCFITESLWTKINLLVQIISDDSIHWATQILRLIHCADCHVWGDSSFDTIGGCSTDFGIYWHIQSY